MVQTAVGVRCPECAGLKKLPTYQVNSVYYLRAAGAGLGIALLCGAAWGFLNSLLSFFLFSILLGAAAGFAIGEVVSLAANRKRGNGLATVGGTAVVISYIIGVLVPWGTGFSLIDILAVAAGVSIAVIRIR
jgi:hypothetical protein